MQDKKGLDFIDLLIIIAKWKKFLLVTFFSVAILSYIFIYFLVEEQYDANALIIPTEDNQMGGFSSILKDLSSLPLNFGGLNSRNDIDLYISIIYSRSNLEKVVRKFNLLKEYQVENYEEAIKVLEKKINAEETKEEGLQISVRANSPKKAAEITNFLVEELNSTIIDMNVKKSRENRQFLEVRYHEIKNNLKNSEDSLRHFQEISGIYAAEDQAKSIIEAYTKFESELAVKEVELSVYERIYGKNSPQANAARIAAEQFSTRLNTLKKGEKNSLLVGLKSLPEKGMNYLRYYRDVEIYNAMLQFIIPMYEQARFNEQKDIPILQVLDYAVPPVKKAYPQRTLMSVGFAVAIEFLIIFYIVLRGILINTNNPKIKQLQNEMKFSKIIT